MDRRDQIVDIVTRRGPVLPSQINKEINTNILFASAMLSELVDIKKLKLSHVKVGGSPLYYVAGQESKLVQYRDRLHEKEQSAFDLLKENKILEDRSQDAVIRVALREIKDFAVPLEVTNNGNSYIFWKWYLLNNEDVEDLIRQELERLEKPPEPAQEQQQVQQAPVQEQVQQKQEVQQDLNKISHIEEKQQEMEKPVEEKSESREEPKQEKTAQVQEIDQEKTSALQDQLLGLKEELKNQLDELRKQKEEMYKKQKEEMERQERLHEQRRKELDERKDELEQLKKDIQKERNEFKKQRAQDSKQQTLVEEEEEGLKLPENDEFFNQIDKFFKKSSIEILEFEMIRKNSEMDMIINLPTNVGSIKYFCKAKSKQKINEGDLSTAYVKSQMKKLPGLFLTTGDLTKRASEMLENEFKNMHVKQI